MAWDGEPNAAFVYLGETPPVGFALWPGRSFFVGNVETREIFEVGPSFALRTAWELPVYEFQWEVIDEISLVDRPACPHAVVALVK